MRYHLATAALLLATITVMVRQFASAPPVTHVPSNTHPAGESIQATVAAIDQQFEQHWANRDLAAAPRADRMTVARRLVLAMAGTIPSLEDQRQLEQFAHDTDAITWWCDHLLEDRRYADYQAERLARALVGVEDGPFLIFRRRRFVSWLSDRIHENVPYDQLVRELITAGGLWTDAPAVNFLTVTTSEDNEGRPDPVRLAGRTSRAFLGVRLDCMQCHDDNLDGEWLQSDFHELAAFYAGATPTLVGIVDKERDYEYQYLGQANSEVVAPEVPFNEELLIPTGNNRVRLADWVTHPENRPFARAIANRLWGLAFGRPLVEPVDQIPLNGPFPPGLEALADDLIANGFDLARLWRIIAQCEPFWKSSTADFGITATHENAYAVFPISRLRPEQIAGAILQSARLDTVDANSHVLVRLGQFGQLQDFNRRYGDAGEDELNPHGGTVPQRLLMMNGKLIKERTRPDMVTNACTRIANLAASPSAAIKAAYRTILVREPTEPEMSHFVNLFASDETRSLEIKLEDLAWVLMNSTEFSWNH